MRRNIVTIVAVVAAICAAAETIRVKQMAVAEQKIELLQGEKITNFRKQAEDIEKLKTRIGLLQKFLHERGLYNEQPCPDDGLEMPGVYPQLIYAGAGNKP